MAGRGPAPKLGENLRHQSKARTTRKRAAVTGRAGARPVPSGEWHPRAVEWWERATTADGAQAWDEASWSAAERCVALADEFWSARDAGEPERMLKAQDRLRLQESALFLSPVDRVRGIRDGVFEPRDAVKPLTPVRAAQTASRARLKAVESG